MFTWVGPPVSFGPPFAALLLLHVILISATAVGVPIAIAVSVIVTAACNFFLLPPFNENVARAT